MTVVLVATGSAQTPGGRTLTVLDDTTHATQAFIDSAPKSPTRNPRARAVPAVNRRHALRPQPDPRR